MKASLARVNGAVKIKINGELFDPISFRSFWPRKGTVENFSGEGFRLMSVFPTGVNCSLGVPYSQFGEVWTGEGKYNWDNLRKQMDMFVSAAPSAHLSLMAQLDTRDWFLRENPECSDSFDYLVRVAGYKKWRESASRFMCDMIDYLEKNYPERIFAVFLMCGGTTEWYTRKDHYDYDPLKERVYQSWLKDAAKTLPTVEEMHRASWGIFRHPAKEKDAIDYDRFHHELIADAINYFAKRAKRHTKRRLLVGAFFGYVMDYSHDRLYAGDMALRQVLESKDIDVLFAPAAYSKHRQLESASGLRMPVSSISLRKKLYFHEIDNATHLVNGNQYAKRLQQAVGGNKYPSHVVLKSHKETVAYLKREMALACSAGQGYWWFDMFGGWYDDKRLMGELGKMRASTERLYKSEMSSVSELAVFMDQDSIYCMSPTQHITDTTVKLQTEELSRAGLPWDCYLADDIARKDMPHGQYKLYVFLNLFAPKRQHLEAVARLRREGKSMLFLYAPGLVSEKGFSMAAMRRLSGFKLKELEWRGRSEFRIVLPKGKRNRSGGALEMGPSRPLKPMFFADEPSAEAIGVFKESGKTAFALKRRGKGLGFDAWAASGIVPGAVLRELAREAGAFIYSETPDPVYINKGMLAMFCHEGGKRTLRMPRDCRLEELFSGERLELADGRASTSFEPDEIKIFEIQG